MVTSLSLALPRARFGPLQWAASVLFGEMLGLELNFIEGEEAEAVLAGEGRKLVMASRFPDLDADRSSWASQMPPPEPSRWDAAEFPEADTEGPLPVLFGSPSVRLSEHEIRCEVDVLGTAFFMLSRFEEIVLPDRDRHGRFPAEASLACRGDFLHRPILDEYAELLWAMMTRLWPRLSRIKREGQIRISCDVDYPFDGAGTNPRALIRSLAADVLKRRNPPLAIRRTRNFVTHRYGDLRFDPNYTFDRYMRVCEQNGLAAAFYFIADHSAGAIDGSYRLEEPRVLRLLGEIAARGHEIGMHGSYNTFRDGVQIRKERERLAAACEASGADGRLPGNRQHFLRWDAGETPDHLENAGFEYDTTGSFADRPGFRYGTSYPFVMWSWRAKAPLALRQHPLVLMESSVISRTYMDLGYSDEAWRLMTRLARASMRRGGDFTLLWHNSHLLTDEDWQFFEALAGKQW